jgi:dienelactone hydrolase
MIYKILFLTFFVSLASCKEADEKAQLSLYPSLYVNANFQVPNEAPRGIKQVWLKDKYHTYYGGSGPRVIVYFHGNGENLRSLHKVGMIEAISNYGAFVIPDYPSYGKSSGEPSESALVDMGVEAVAFAKRTHPGKRVVLWGWSLGSGVAGLVAAKVKADALILVSPWDNMKKLMLARTDDAKYVSSSWHKKNSYNLIKASASWRLPTIIFMVNDDQSIPNENTLNLISAISPPFEFLRINAPKHNQVYRQRSFWAALESFMREHSPGVWYEADDYFINRPPPKRRHVEIRDEKE